MRWALSWRADPAAAAIADRHYSRQAVGSAQFVPPGRCLVLMATSGPALWVTSWPFERYVNRAFPGAWTCSLFRNEGAGLSSELILEAIAATRWRWPDVPAAGMVTMIDEAAVRSKRDPGYCYLIAGFEHAGRTKDNDLLILRLPPERMPEAEAPIGAAEAML